MIRAGLYDADTSWPIARVGWEDAAIPFQVLPKGTEKDNRHLVDGDVMDVEVDWQ
ncbi:hypothetical protein GF356_10520 [candidate division GN15 bacterium]|nr:hypothetical protein [candidate division GN15 bacterium]